MTPVASQSPSLSPKYISPNRLADYLSLQQSCCLFLDIDGTLAEFTLDPKTSFIPDATLTILHRLQRCGLPIAIVTGRSLTEARQMLYPLQLPIAATHGLEIAWAGHQDKVIYQDESGQTTVDLQELAEIRQAVIQRCSDYHDFTIENKAYSIALHYRQNPSLAELASTIMTNVLVNYANWSLKSGKYVLEAVPKGVNKGAAILTLMQHMPISEHCYPIFIGDDITDEAGFMAVQGEGKDDDSSAESEQLCHRRINGKDNIRGMGIKVGEGPSCAQYYLKDLGEVSILLKSLLDIWQQRPSLSAHYPPSINIAEASINAPQNVTGLNQVPNAP